MSTLVEPTSGESVEHIRVRDLKLDHVIMVRWFFLLSFSLLTKKKSIVFFESYFYTFS